jgi:hypothetical protein
MNQSPLHDTQVYRRLMETVAARLDRARKAL